MLGSLFKKSVNGSLFSGIMKKTTAEAGTDEEDLPHYMRSMDPKSGRRRQSIQQGAAAALEAMNPAKRMGKGSPRKGSLSPREALRKDSAAPPNPGLKRTLTRRFTLNQIAPSPEQIAAANANDLGEVVIEVVLASGLKKPTRVGTPAPSPFVKLTVRGSEKRSKKQERTLFPMWNERLVWAGKRGELCTPKMLVEVLAWDPLTPTSMGRAEVDLAELIVGTACETMVALGEVRPHA
jgi:hypothetical protein